MTQLVNSIYSTKIWTHRYLLKLILLRNQLHFKIHFNCTVQWVLTNIYIHVSRTIIKILNSSVNTKLLLSVSSHFHTTLSLSKNWSISATQRWDVFSSDKYKMSDTIYALLCLTTSTQHNVFEIHLRCCIYQ